MIEAYSMTSFPFILNKPLVVAGSLVMMVVLTGCGREEVRAYQVPKEARREPQAGTTLPAGQAPAEHIKFVAPPGWEEREAGGIRVARLVVVGPDGPAADVSVMPMPGISASKKDIVNLWRDQLKLSPISDTDLPGMTEAVEIATTPGELFEFVSAEPLIDDKQKARILVAMLNRSGTTWFFKLTGEDAFVSAQKPAFLSFLKSVSFVPGAPATIRGAGGFAAGSDTGAGPASTESGEKPEWEVPAGWREVPPTQMVLAKFAIGGDNGAGEVSVSAFPGDVGGVSANVNRWRDQIGLEPVPAGEMDRLVTSLDVMGGKAMVVDMTGKKGAQETRLIGVIVPRGGQTWFYKLTGDAAVAEREKRAFLKFVQSIRYSNA